MDGQPGPPSSSASGRESGSEAHAWAPLRIRAFRAMWVAVLVSNVGIWMQTVGAQWLLVHRPHAPILVSLVQTADMLPDVLFGLVGGVLADTLDRRQLLIGVQGFMALTAGALAALTFAGQMPPALLLTFTVILGSGSVLSNPAYQSLIPVLVPRDQLPAAASLGSITVNLARVIGPALAGILIARAGVGAVFAVDAATFLIYAVVVAAWRPPPGMTVRSGERFGSALRAGARYVRYSPVERRVLVRAALFLFPASALWALLPLISTERLGQNAGGYGLLLGALGVGAVLAALLLPATRQRVSINVLLLIATLVYAVVLVAVVLVRSTAIAVLVLLPAGAAWIAVLASVNSTLQLFLPTWVRARGLSVYLMVMFGSQAIGAALWGAVASRAGLVSAFLIAAGAMVAGAASFRVWPLIDTRGMDRSAVAPWEDPVLLGEADTDSSGPVVVSLTYTVAPDAERELLTAMKSVRLSRLRTGASQWGLFRDADSEHVFVELFVVASWDEHIRQHRDRLTGADQRFLEHAENLSDPPPRTEHLIAVDVPEGPHTGAG